jgi:methionine synthase II (cobalamin-independent)
LIGDYGGTNSGPNTLTQQFAMHWGSPALSILVDAAGYVRMQYGYGSTSDERLKTNIQTIENALDKTLLLRGVEYNDFRIEPERKKIGLIAQEVELIVPEVVRTNKDDGLKSIEYQNLVGLLVEAIKQLNNKVITLENVLKNNNLN